ncbi:hypothetical protein NK499_002235 [Vibrio cholerae]|nr:hypothetical protein [Vibrio cholerae]
MNFLELCQRLRSEIKDSGDGPSNVERQRGDDLKIVEAVREAWTELQLCRTWSPSFWVEPFNADAPQVLTKNIDVPFIRAELHILIVWKAMYGLAISDAAQEKVIRANDEYDRLFLRMCNQYLPTLTL